MKQIFNTVIKLIKEGLNLLFLNALQLPLLEGHCAAEDGHFKRYNRKQYVSMSDL